MMCKKQSCQFRFGDRFGLSIGTEYFGTGVFWRSISRLPQNIYIYIYIYMYVCMY
jgi:hypothetical protein